MKKAVLFLSAFISLSLISTLSFAAGGAEPAPESAAAERANSKERKKASNDWSYKRHKQVAQIFPEHTANKEATVRPEKVQLVAPKFLEKVSGTSVKLEWQAAGRAQHYHVQVSKDAGFNNRSMYVAEDKWVSGTSFEVTGLEPGVKYFWRVAAHNKDQDSMYTKSLFTSSSFEIQ